MPKIPYIEKSYLGIPNRVHLAQAKRMLELGVTPQEVLAPPLEGEKMGGWHKVSTLFPKSPCGSCQAGWGSYSSCVDKHGDLWIKCDDCSETCERLKKWREENES